MRGIFRTTIVLSAIALLLCGLFIGVTFAAFTTHDKGIANVNIGGIGQTTFTVTSTDKYYPGMTDGVLNISLTYGQTNDMAVRISDVKLDSYGVKYAWYDSDITPADGVINLTVVPKTGSWSAGTGKSGWYSSGTEYIYYSNTASTNWRCTLNNGVPTFYYNSTVAGGTTLPTFTCNVSVKAPPTGELDNNVIDGFGQIDTTSAYLLDNCENVKFNFSLLATQV